MSGINEIKKKAKLSIEEMYDNQEVGKLDYHKNENPFSKQANQPDKHTLSKQTVFTNNQTEDQQANNQSSQENELSKNILNNKPKIQFTNQPLYQRKSQMIKEATYKMTFNLTPEIYKAFNDLYAYRMLNGCKTDKSELICEAIALLLQTENMN